MRFAIFGLAVSSSWGNGHAVLWRGLIAALLRAGHRVVFFERDVPYYAANRDLNTLPDGGELVLYPAWDDVRARAEAVLAASDVAIVTSYFPDALAAADRMQRHRHLVRCFYDLDTPVTLARLAAGEHVPYLGEDGLAPYDLVLSYTGGRALTALRDRLGARRVAPLYGWVDPENYRPATPGGGRRAALSYLGTYAEDRQATLENLFVAAARGRPAEKFVIGGAQYPQSFPWTDNIWFVRHVPPSAHPGFYADARLTLNVTRGAMAAMGWCPSGRLFEAASCGAPIVSDRWEGLETFFAPGDEILIADDTDDALAAIDLDDATLAAIARRACARVLDQHTAAHRAATLVAAIESAGARQEA